MEYLPVQEKYTPQILPLIMEKSYLYHIYEANQNHNTSLNSFYSYTNGCDKYPAQFHKNLCT